MACEERNFVSFEDPEHISFRRITEGRLQADFPRLRESGHVIEPATADDSNFRFRQRSPPPATMTEEWQARDYTEGNSLACGGSSEHLLLHLIGSRLIQALAHQYRIPLHIDHNRALFREPRVFAS